KKYQASTSAFKAVLLVSGMELSLSGTVKEQAPDKLRIESSMKVAGEDHSFMQVVNGSKGWMAIDGNDTEMPKEALTQARQQVHVRQLASLRALSGPGTKVTALGASKVEDTPVVGLHVVSDGFSDVNLYFDKDSGLLVKLETKGIDPMGGGEFKEED